jgi:tRNA G18 (ribose-2'-O)-methylase SpoU
MPPIHPIAVEDFEDPRIADYRNLKDATLAARRGRFVVEGPGNVEVLLARSRFAPESLLVSEKSWQKMRCRIEDQAPECPVYVAGQPLLDAIVGFPIHRGVLAVCERPSLPASDELLDQILEADPEARIVVTESVGNHDNLGGIFRNAMALGARAVLLCPRSCDPLYRKAIRTSMGGTLCVPFARAADWPAEIERLRGRGFRVLALDPGHDEDRPATPLRTLDPMLPGALALLVGTEGPGLSDEALEQADQRIRIEMEPGVDSLNVAVAVGIALHALRRPPGNERLPR